MELLFRAIFIVEKVALQYLIIVLLFLLACPACPRRSVEDLRKASIPLALRRIHEKPCFLERGIFPL